MWVLTQQSLHYSMLTIIIGKILHFAAFLLGSIRKKKQKKTENRKYLIMWFIEFSVQKNKVIYFKQIINKKRKTHINKDVSFFSSHSDISNSSFCVCSHDLLEIAVTHLNCAF